MKKILLFIFIIIFCPASFVNAETTNEPFIDIISPSEGEYLEVGKTYKIEWEQRNVNSVSISYRNKSSRVGDWIEFILPVDESLETNSIEWLVPEELQGDEGEFDISITGRIDNKNTTIYSDGFYIDWPGRDKSNPESNSNIYFTIPHKDSILVIGKTYNLTWDSDLNNEKAKFINLWLDMGEDEPGYNRIIPITSFEYNSKYYNSNSVINTNSFSWTVPETINVNEVDFNNGVGYDYQLFFDNNSYEMLARGVKVYPTDGQILFPQPDTLKPGKYRIFATFSSGLDAFLFNTGNDESGVLITKFGLKSGVKSFSDYFQISNLDSANIENDKPVSVEVDKNIHNNNNDNNEEISYSINIKNKAMHQRLRGKIMLKVEDAGKAYYIHPSTQEMHYLGRPDDAFSVMREQGVGINNINLEKIPVGLDNLIGPDSDSDGLSDLFEDAIGTDKNNKDTDGDGYNDKDELSGNYNPNGSGKLNLDNSFTQSQNGKIFLQIERNGEAWYINPNDGKRYFLGRPADAFNVMRNLGLGISNNDFDSL